MKRKNTTSFFTASDGELDMRSENSTEDQLRGCVPGELYDMNFNELDKLHADIEEIDQGSFKSKSVIEADESDVIRYDIDEFIHLTLLSRAVECLRFTLPAEMLEEEITLGKLHSEFERLEITNQECKSTGGQGQAHQVGIEGDAEVSRMDEIDQHLRTLWASYERMSGAKAERMLQREARMENEREVRNARKARRRMSLSDNAAAAEAAADLVRQQSDAGQSDGDSSPRNIASPTTPIRPPSREVVGERWHLGSSNFKPPEDGKMLTFGDLLDYQFPSFPETTSSERKKLKWLSKRRAVIAVHDVCELLNVEKDSQVVEYIFYCGATVLSAEVFKEIIASLDVNPRLLSFGPMFAHQMVEVSRRGQPLIPNLIILIIIIVIAPIVSNVSQFTLYTGVVAHLGNDWANGCPFGTTDELGCQFLRRNFETIEMADFDAVRFAREEFLLRMWPTSGSRATDQTFGSTWLVGSLSARLVPKRYTIPETEHEVLCDASNISTYIYHHEFGEHFSCDNIWVKYFSFNSTQEEVLAQAESITLSQGTKWGVKPLDLALQWDFTGYQRSNGLLVHTRITVALPAGGTALPHADVTPIDPHTVEHILPILIAQLISWGLFMGNTIFLQSNGIFSFGGDFLISTLSAALISMSYGYLRHASPFSTEEGIIEQLGGSLYQVDYLPPDMDRIADNYNMGMSILGFYIVGFTVCLSRFFRDVAGLELVIKVISKSYVELISLAFIFVVWTLGFTCCAMVIFGSTVPKFASFTQAWWTLLDFFQGDTAYTDLVDYHPIVGPAYFFVYQLFVVMFALNLLVAVVTNPLSQVKEELNSDNKLLRDIQDDIIVKKEGSTDLDVFKWYFYSHIWLPLVSVFYSARPLGSTYWLKMHLSIQNLYPDDGSLDPMRCLRTASELTVRFRDTQVDVEEWNSDLLRHVHAKKLIQGKVSLALCIAMCAAESPLRTVRDSRLLTAITQYSRWIMQIESIKKRQDGLRALAHEQTKNFENKLQAAAKIAAETLAKLDEEEMADVSEIPLSGLHGVSETSWVAECLEEQDDLDALAQSMERTVSPALNSDSDEDFEFSTHPDAVRRRRSNAKAAFGAKELSCSFLPMESSIKQAHRFDAESELGSKKGTDLLFCGGGEDSGDPNHVDGEKHAEEGATEAINKNEHTDIEEVSPAKSDVSGVDVENSPPRDDGQAQGQPLVPALKEELNPSALQKPKEQETSSPRPHKVGFAAMVSGPSSAKAKNSIGAKFKVIRAVKNMTAMSGWMKPKTTFNTGKAGSAGSVVDPNTGKVHELKHATKAPEQRYFFAEEVNSELGSAVYIMIYAVCVVVFFTWFMVPFFNVDNPTAWMSKSIDNGLRDMWWTTNCFDGNCTGGQTWGKVFMDNVHMTDFRDWMAYVLEPALFRRRRLNVTDPEFPNLEGVKWDPRIIRTTPVTIRQLRGKRIPCKEMVQTQWDKDRSTTLLADRMATVHEQPCFAQPGNNLDGWEQGQLPYPGGGNVPPARLGASAYTFNEKCTTKPELYYGLFFEYPCHGYFAVVNDTDSLREVIDPTIGWLDNATRLVQVTATFAVGKAKVEYSMFAEFGDLGEQTAGSALAFPISPEDILERTFPHRITFQVAVCVNLAIILYWTIRYWVALYCQKMDPDLAAQYKPSGIPWLLILVFIITFIVARVAFADPRHQGSVITICCITYVMKILTGSVVFPAAAMWSKDVKTLVSTLWIAAYYCLYVFPFLIIFYIGFTYGGMVVFGRGVQNFARPRFSLATIILGTFGFSDDIFDDEDLEAFRPIEAQLFIFVFFVVVLILLANMFLAMVTSASSDAQASADTITVAEDVQVYFRRRPMYGEWVTAFLAINVFWVQFKQKYPKLIKKLPRPVSRWMNKKRTSDAVVLSGWGRLWFPCECLLPVLRPMRVTYILNRFLYDDLNAYAYGALIPYVLQHYIEFEERNQVKHARDESENAFFVTEFVKEVARTAVIEGAKNKFKRVQILKRFDTMQLEAARGAHSGNGLGGVNRAFGGVYDSMADSMAQESPDQSFDHSPNLKEVLDKRYDDRTNGVPRNGWTDDDRTASATSQGTGLNASRSPLPSEATGPPMVAGGVSTHNSTAASSTSSQGGDAEHAVSPALEETGGEN